MYRTGANRGESMDVQVFIRGLPERPLGDLYHYLLTAPGWTLFLMIVLLYAAINSGFALVYLSLGNAISNARPGSFWDAFFFSVQTMATIGYGTMAPHTFGAHLMVAVEALTGMIGIAMATGLMFAKFARPTARVMFSRQALIAPHNGVRSLMFRMANARANGIAEAQLRVLLLRNERTAEGQWMRRFVDLPLVRRESAVFALTWTAIHPIDEKSPLHGVTAESLASMDAQIIVSLTGLDDTLSQTIHARYTYTMKDLVLEGRYVDIISDLPTGGRLIDYTHFHSIVSPEDRTPTKDAAAP
jgi:inward rectifier potassium channel